MDWRGRDECVAQSNSHSSWYYQFLVAPLEPAEAVEAAWRPLLSGQAIPLIGEEVLDGDFPCVDRGH